MISIVKDVRRLKKLAISIGVLGLLVLLVVCRGSSDKVGLAGIPARVSKNDFRITSSIKPFTSGVRYHLVIRNNGQRVHAFIVSETPFTFNVAFSR